MLAVEDPENPWPLLPFSRYSRGLYSQFLKVIEELSGQHVFLRTQETVQAVDPAHASSQGVPLSPDEARSLVPGLRATHHNYRLLEEASLDPRELCTALRSAVVAAGVALHEQERVLSVDSEGKDVLLTTARRAMHANAFVNCCGAWAASLDASVEIAPCKGQMLVVAQPSGPQLTRVLRSPDVYLIPRGDGRIVIGATIEHAVYSRQVDPAALSLLRHSAAALWPPAADAPELESWAGLRPASADGLPCIGRCERSENPGCTAQFIATGHYRNGILLAPGTAHVIADLLSGVAPAIDLASFSPSRASISASCDKHFAAAL
jgi:glycine oxidase